MPCQLRQKPLMKNVASFGLPSFLILPLQASQASTASSPPHLLTEISIELFYLLGLVFYR